MCLPAARPSNARPQCRHRRYRATSAIRRCRLKLLFLDVLLFFRWRWRSPLNGESLSPGNPPRSLPLLRVRLGFRAAWFHLAARCAPTGVRFGWRVPVLDLFTEMEALEHVATASRSHHLAPSYHGFGRLSMAFCPLRPPFPDLRRLAPHRESPV